MATWGKTKLTALGEALLEKLNTGGTLTLNRVKFGDGVWPDPESPSAMTDLVNVKVPDLPIRIIEGSVTGKKYVEVLYDNTLYPSGFTLGEAGIYAEDPDVGEILYAACYAGDTGDELPDSSITPFESLIKFHTKVGNATDVVTVFIEPTLNVIKRDFPANSILVGGEVDNVPEALVVEEDTIVGRKAGGLIEKLIANNVLEIINKATNKAIIAAQPGLVLPWPTSSVPEGFLSCNGASVSRTTYADLFAVIGTEYGSVDADSFLIPDYRGEFLRGWDNGANNDPDKANRKNKSDVVVGDIVGSMQSDELKLHNHFRIKYANWAGTGGVLNGGGAAADDLTIQTGGNETRSRNISVHFIIKI
jgi:microcystin-dependent protein